MSVARNFKTVRRSALAVSPLLGGERFVIRKPDSRRQALDVWAKPALKKENILRGGSTVIQILYNYLVAVGGSQKFQ